MNSVRGHRELGASQHLAHHLEALQQCQAIRNDNPGVATHDLRIARRQMELALTDVDPHVADAGHQVRVAREAEAHDIENRRQPLVRNARIDVLKANDIAEILDRSVELI